MTIDLRYTIPLVSPFLFYGFIRVFWFLTVGPMHFDGVEFVAFLSLLFGVPFGAMFASTFIKNPWNIRIGGRHD